MLERKFRLGKQQSVARVYKKGRTARAGSLSIRYLANNQEDSRLTVVVSKKVAKSAVTRNRIRRRLSETLRHRWADITPGVDIIVTAYEVNLATVNQNQLNQLIDQLLTEAQLLK